MNHLVEPEKWGRSWWYLCADGGWQRTFKVIIIIMEIAIAGFRFHRNRSGGGERTLGLALLFGLCPLLCSWIVKNGSSWRRSNGDHETLSLQMREWRRSTGAGRFLRFLSISTKKKNNNNNRGTQKRGMVVAVVVVIVAEREREREGWVYLH